MKTSIYCAFIYLVSIVSWDVALAQPVEAETRLKDPPNDERGWTLHAGANATFNLAPERSPEARRQLPWRPVESPVFSPARLELGVTYRFGERGRGRIDVGGALSQRPSFWNAPLSPLYLDATSAGDPLLGELSVTWPLGRTHQLTVGRFLYRVGSGERASRLHHAGGEMGLSHLEWEERYWSWSGSPLERWTSGLSISGVLWGEGSQEELSPARAESQLYSAYRINIARPHERLAQIEQRGALFTGVLSLGGAGWSVETQAIWGYSLDLSDELKRATDSTLQTARAVQRLRRLSDLSIDYSGLWWRSAGRARLGRSGRFAYWVSGSLEVRDVEIEGLSQLEEAALAESNTVGDGRVINISFYVLSQGSLHSSLTSRSALPDRWEISYQGRDPDQRFGYDDRHSVRAAISYLLSPTWGEISASLWYLHLWSATDNRFNLESDLGGLTIEVSR